MATPGVGSVGRCVHGDKITGINYSNQELPPPENFESIFYSRRYRIRDELSLFHDIINQLNLTSVSGFPMQPQTDTAAASAGQGRDSSRF